MKIAIRNKQARGFTLIEMIGVLAVIAILAALLIPKIFEAINNARINNAAVSVQTIKTALADHYAKYGSLGVDGSTTPVTPFATTNEFDKILLKEGFIDKPFAVKIGDGATTRIQLRAADSDPTTAATASNAAYNLDGDSTTSAANDATGSQIVEAFISGVSLLDAKELNDRIDGTTLGASSVTAGTPPVVTTSDLLGRVKYEYTDANATTDVYIYLTHR